MYPYQSAAFLLSSLTTLAQSTDRSDVACVQPQTPKEVGTAQLRTKACYARSARFPDFWENNLCKKINTLNMLPLE